MARRKQAALPPRVIHMNMPCKNGQRYVHPVDGSCLRCGADQGVHGYACGDPMEEEVMRTIAEFDAAIAKAEGTPPHPATSTREIDDADSERD